MIPFFDTNKLITILDRENTDNTFLSKLNVIFSPSSSSEESSGIWLPFEIVSFAATKRDAINFPLTARQFLSELKVRLNKKTAILDKMYIEGVSDNDFLFGLSGNHYNLYIPWLVDNVSRYPVIYDVLGIADFQNGPFLYWEIDKDLVVRWTAWPREAPEKIGYNRYRR